VPGPFGRASFLGESAPEHDPEKWIPVFRRGHAQTKEMELDDDSKKRHHAPVFQGLSSAIRNSGSRLSGEIARPPLHDQKKSHEPS
jgi:hypothetical protein